MRRDCEEGREERGVRRDCEEGREERGEEGRGRGGEGKDV